jgi:hypothetical protein
MFTMQTFYARLHALTKGGDAFFNILEKLTNCSLEEISAIKSEMVWEVWDSTTD